MSIVVNATSPCVPHKVQQEASAGRSISLLSSTPLLSVFDVEDAHQNPLRKDRELVVDSTSSSLKQNRTYGEDGDDFPAQSKRKWK